MTSLTTNKGANNDSVEFCSHAPLRHSQMQLFSGSLVLLCITYVGLLLGLAQFTMFPDDVGGQIQQYYQYLLHVNIMVFVGFGFLMTFLRRYSFGAVALNMAASAVVFLEAILVVGAMQQVAFGQGSGRIVIGVPLLIDSAFCAASSMIAYGAVIGKTTPAQLLWLVVAQVPIYAANQHLVIHVFKALDMGGTIVIHLFGAYYGLAASFMLSRRQGLHGVSHPKNISGYLNDVIAMVGTLFLFLYWPSFNAALASVPQDGPLSPTEAQASSQFLSIVNTLLSLLGSTIATFAISALTGHGRLNMMHVQNSSLAGGVAMGAACTLNMTPGGSVLVGTAAGALSVCGYVFITPALDRLLDLGDTCGIHNLHGMPAILGGLVAGLASLGQSSGYLNYDTGSMQLGYQIAAMVSTVAIGVSGGLIVGFLMSLPYRGPSLTPTEMFDDGVFWHGMDVEAAAPTAPLFELNASVYARNNNAPESVRSAFQVGITAPPRLPPSPFEGNADILFLSRIPIRNQQSNPKTLEDYEPSPKSAPK